MTEGRALLLAGGAHLALLAALSLSWAMRDTAPPRFAEAIPVEIVEVSDLPRITQPPQPSIDAAPQELIEAAAAPEAQTAAETPPPEPTPAPQPVKPRDASATKRQSSERLNPEELANLIDKSLPRARTRTRNPSEFAKSIEQALPKGAKIDARMTATLEQAARAQIAPCWNPPLGGADVDKMAVVLEFSLTRAGEVIETPRVVRQNGVSAGNAAYARSFAEAAKRAVLRCAPIKLPAEYYEVWKDFELTFDQTGMT